MAYRELATTGPLVACLWVRDGDAEADSRPRRILPDACADIVWTGRELIVAGPATHAVMASLPADRTVLGVRFRVGAAGAALGLPASELLDRSVLLEDVWGADGARIADAVATTPTLSVLAHAVGAKLAHGNAPDRLVRAAATGAQPNIGARQLRRRFADAVGYGPKTLQRILRFQRFLALAERSPAPDLARLALEAAYADQAHLTRECRRLAGLTPAALLASGAGPAGERSVSFKTAGLVAATLAA
jgi:AraC-like DNA-binding protein